MGIMINMLQHMVNPQLSTSDNPKMYKGKPFHIYGFDILIDKNLKSWILEINDYPSFNIVCCTEGKDCDHECCPISQVDLYVKKTGMSDIL